MQKESLLNVLMYVFENYYDKARSISIKTKHITDDMLKAGFEANTIVRAISWFKELNVARKALKADKHFPGGHAFRVLTRFEHEKMTSAAQSGLLYLEQIGIVDALTREIVLDRMMMLGERIIDLPELKWVTLMVLFSQKKKRDELALIESLILHTGFFTGDQVVCH